MPAWIIRTRHETAEARCFCTLRPGKEQADSCPWLSRRCSLILLLVLLAGLCAGCALLTPGSAMEAVPSIAHFSYNAAADRRSMSDMISDTELQLRVKQELMQLRVKDGFFLNVYVFQGRVFLVGDPPPDFREAAVRFAMREEGVQSLDYCFFPPDSGSLFGDFIAGCALRFNLLLEPGISSSWVKTEIYGGNAVLLGVVEDAEAAARITRIAENSSGISRVISFLLIENTDYTPPPEFE